MAISSIRWVIVIHLIRHLDLWALSTLCAILTIIIGIVIVVILLVVLLVIWRVSVRH